MPLIPICLILLHSHGLLVGWQQHSHLTKPQCWQIADTLRSPSLSLRVEYFLERKPQ